MSEDRPESIELLTITKAAKELGIDRHSVVSFLDTGELEYIWVQKRRRIPRWCLAQWQKRSVNQTATQVDKFLEK